MRQLTVQVLIHRLAGGLFSITALVCLLSSPLASALEVQVKGLFKDAALLEIDGQPRLLKTGKRSPEGVKLISASSREAVIDVAGKRQALGLSQHISSTFTVAEKNEVRIASGRGGHYITPGRINGLAVEFLVDTGATLVAMNLPTAKKLGINYRAGDESFARTANGVTPVYLVNLAAVSVGNVEVKNVRATVHLGNSPDVILLGNSFLSRVEMNRESGVLVLSSQH